MEDFKKMILLKVHGNCRNYKFNQSRPADEGHCNLSSEKLDPLCQGCDEFEEGF